MATLQEFVGELRRVEGVGGYLLVRRDGHLLAHNVEDPEGMASLVAVVGLTAGKVQADLGLQDFRYLVFGGEEGYQFLLFSLGNYFLGIAPAAPADGPQVTATMIRFLRGFVTGRSAPA